MCGDWTLNKKFYCYNPLSSVFLVVLLLLFLGWLNEMTNLDELIELEHKYAMSLGEYYEKNKSIPKHIDDEFVNQVKKLTDTSQLERSGDGDNSDYVKMCARYIIERKIEIDLLESVRTQYQSIHTSFSGSERQDLEVGELYKYFKSGWTRTRHIRKEQLAYRMYISSGGNEQNTNPDDEAKSTNVYSDESDVTDML